MKKIILSLFFITTVLQAAHQAPKPPAVPAMAREEERCCACSKVCFAYCAIWGVCMAGNLPLAKVIAPQEVACNILVGGLRTMVLDYHVCAAPNKECVEGRLMSRERAQQQSCVSNYSGK
jgi:hypothetical protein